MAADETDRLYELPLDEFTAARNELAARLKKDGDADAAAEVRGLAKPTAPVWAVNQAARRDRDGVRALLEAGDALRKAQARALAKTASGDDLRDAQRAERHAVQRLVAGARAALEEEGRKASADQLERIERTLSAAAVDEQAASALEAGRLAHELEPGGFEALASLAPAGRRRRSAAPAKTRESERQRLRRRSAEREAHDAEKRAREAEREAERAARAAERARSVAEKARAAADAAAAKLQAL